MPSNQPLTPGTPDELEWTLAHALRFDGRKQFKTSSELTAKITAAHLAECLRQSGFVVMKAPPPSLPQGCAYAESARKAMDAAPPATSKGGPKGG